MSNNTSSPTLQDLSLLNLQTLLLSAYEDIAIVSANLFFCGINLYVMSVHKLFQNPHFLIPKVLFLNDSFNSLFNIVFVSWHLIHYFTGTGELINIDTCFYIAAIQVLILLPMATLDFALAFDRFMCVWTPFKYRHLGKAYYIPVIVTCYLLSLLVWLALRFEPLGNATLIYCSIRTSLGPIGQYGWFALILCVHIGTTLMYGITLLAVRYQVSDSTALHVLHLKKSLLPSLSLNYIFKS